MISNCHIGIYLLFNASNLLISNNTFHDNDIGIESLLTLKGLDNIVCNNTFSNHFDTAINFSELTHGFTLFHNHFLQNNHHAFDMGNNTWYQPDLEQGNYWDDYTGNDTDADGIGDSPYSISGGANKDEFPLLMNHAEENQPPSIPSQPLPLNQSNNVLGTVNLSWHCHDLDENDTLHYTIAFGTTNPPPAYIKNHSSNSYSITGLEPETSYYWQITAIDIHNVSSQGPIWWFNTTSFFNHPPIMPNSPVPYDFQENRPINSDLSWISGDIDVGDTVFYDIYFSSSFPPQQIASSYQNTTYNPGLLSYNTTYYWMIVARDSNNAVTAGSLWQFTTAQDSNAAPFPASYPIPYDHEVQVSLNPLFSWVGGDPDGDNVKYDFYFGESQSPSLVAFNLSQPQWNLSVDLSYNTTYYWKIISKDQLGKIQSSPVWSFTTSSPPNHPPFAASNPSPIHNATDVAPPMITFSWEASDPDEDILTYSIFLGENSSSPDMLIASNLNQTQYVFNQLEGNMWYCWQVYCSDSHGAQSESPLWWFNTSNNTNLAPFAPFQPLPTDNDVVNIKENITLSWTGGDPDDELLSYDVYFGSNSSVSLLGTHLETCKYDLVVNLSVNTTYYWKIIAQDMHGAETSSDLWSFTTYLSNNTAPNTPSNPVPDDSDSNVSRLVTLQWQGGDIDGNSTVDYKIFLDTNNPPSTHVSTVISLHYNPSGLDYNTTYYWKIIAMDDYNDTTVGPVWSFTTKSTNQPPTPMISGPTSGYKGSILSFNADDSTDADGSIVSYSWDFGDNTKKTGRNVDHTYDLVGTYTVKLTVVDSDGDTASTDLSVSIITANHPPTNVQVTGNASVEQNNSYSVTCSATDEDQDRIKFNIDWGDGTIDTTGFISPGQKITETHVFTTDGLMKIRVTAVDEQNAQSQTEQFHVYVNKEEKSSTNEKQDSDAGFPWLWLLFPVILVIFFIGVLLYRRQTSMKQHHISSDEQY